MRFIALLSLVIALGLKFLLNLIFDLEGNNLYSTMSTIPKIQVCHDMAAMTVYDKREVDLSPDFKTAL